MTATEDPHPPVAVATGPPSPAVRERVYRPGATLCPVRGAMGGLAARLAGERYLGVPIDRERHAAVS